MWWVTAWREWIGKHGEKQLRERKGKRTCIKVRIDSTQGSHNMDSTSNEGLDYPMWVTWKQQVGGTQGNGQTNPGDVMRI